MADKILNKINIDDTEYIIAPNIEVEAVSGDHITESGTPTVTSSFENNKTKLTFDYLKGATGKGIKNIEKTSGTGGAGTIDTYTITYSDGTTSEFNVYNGTDGIAGVNGAAAIITDKSTAIIDNTSGTPKVTVETNGTDQARYFTFNFSGLKGNKGEDGIDGNNGIGLQFKWNDTELGVKREDEDLYTFQDIAGPDGPQGPDGIGLQFTWDNTRLGIKREDEQTFSYHDIEGPQGPRGPQGEPGPKGDSQYSFNFNKNTGVLEIITNK